MAKGIKLKSLKVRARANGDYECTAEVETDRYGVQHIEHSCPPDMDWATAFNDLIACVIREARDLS